MLFTRSIVALVAMFFALPQTAQAQSSAEARSIAREAYIYAYAPIASYNTWYKQAVAKGSPEYIGGFNTFKHYAEAFTSDNKDIVTALREVAEEKVRIHYDE